MLDPENYESTERAVAMTGAFVPLCNSDSSRVFLAFAANAGTNRASLSQSAGANQGVGIPLHTTGGWLTFKWAHEAALVGRQWFASGLAANVVTVWEVRKIH